MASPRLDVYVHIGAPKSGTTFVQNVLWSNRGALRDAGVLYPYSKPTEHFRAMLDLRQRGWGSISREAIAGAWERMAARVRDWDGHTAIVTNELLGAASEAQISRLVSSLSPAKVHVVYTARDLARQLLSSWQEQVKHKLPVTFEDFLTEMVEHGPETTPPYAQQFWPLQDAGYVLARWASVVGRENVQLITVPPPDTDASLLWERFCTATGVDASLYTTSLAAGNISLSASEAEFFRRVNASVQDLTSRDYTELVRKFLMAQVASRRGDRLSLPNAYFDRVEHRAQRMVKELETGDYPLIGDLEELIPQPHAHRLQDSPSDTTDDQLLPMAMRSIDVLLHLAAEQRRRRASATWTATTSPAHPPAPDRPSVRSRLRDRAGSVKRAGATLNRRFRSR